MGTQESIRGKKNASEIWREYKDQRIRSIRAKYIEKMRTEKDPKKVAEYQAIMDRASKIVNDEVMK
jgi:hypothetical protein